MDPDRFHVYDTTLRDGAQREGVSYSVADKLAVELGNQPRKGSGIVADAVCGHRRRSPRRRQGRPDEVMIVRPDRPDAHRGHPAIVEGRPGGHSRRVISDVHHVVNGSHGLRSYGRL